MSRVFIAQEPLKMVRGQAVPRFGMSSLARYGDVYCVFDWGELRDFQDPAPLMPKAIQTLADFTDDDWIVPIGNPALIAMVIMAASRANHGRVRVLDWMRNPEQYREVTLQLPTT